MAAMADGLHFLKFFPATAAGGIPLLKALAGPFPDISFCPTGGITPETAPAFLALPNVKVCGGSWLTPQSAVDQGDWALITQLARAAAAMRLDQLKAQIELEQAAARDDLEAALDALDTAAARERAAALVFEIARRKRDAGSLPQIEFIDARAAFTQAELNNNLTRFDALARAAQLDYATAAKPLPDQFAATVFGALR